MGEMTVNLQNVCSRNLLAPPWPLGTAQMRLEAEGISEAEFNQIVEIAVLNYSHFHGLGPQNVSWANVALSSAGLRGWASARIGLPEKVVCLELLDQDADGCLQISCTTAGGETTTMLVTANAPVAELHLALAQELQVHRHVLRLTTSDAR